VSKLVREYDRQVAPPLPGAFIARFASETSLPTAVRQRASELADAVIDDGAHVGQSRRESPRRFSTVLHENTVWR